MPFPPSPPHATRSLTWPRQHTIPKTTRLSSRPPHPHAEPLHTLARTSCLLAPAHQAIMHRHVHVHPQTRHRSHRVHLHLAVAPQYHLPFACTTSAQHQSVRPNVQTPSQRTLTQTRARQKGGGRAGRGRRCLATPAADPPATPPSTCRTSPAGPARGQGAGVAGHLPRRTSQSERREGMVCRPGRRRRGRVRQRRRRSRPVRQRVLSCTPTRATRTTQSSRMAGVERLRLASWRRRLASLSKLLYWRLAARVQKAGVGDVTHMQRGASVAGACA